MSFVSRSFLLFLIISLSCYFISPRRFRWYVLLLSGYVFYWFVGGPVAVAAISFTVMTVYFSGRWAGMLRKKKGPHISSARASGPVPDGKYRSARVF